MRRATLTRTETDERGTFGVFRTDSGFECYTVELPWRNNEKGRSCIPAGTYIFNWRKDSPKHGECYEMATDTEAPGRENVQIHSANWADQLLGCIAPGRSIQEIQHPSGEKVKGVTSSKDALAGLETDLGQRSFELNIVWAKDSGFEVKII
jgi:hypothetical protein